MHTGSFKHLLLHKPRAFSRHGRARPCYRVGRVQMPRTKDWLSAGWRWPGKQWLFCKLGGQISLLTGSCFPAWTLHHWTTIEHFSMVVDVVMSVPYSVVSTPAILTFNFSAS